MEYSLKNKSFNLPNLDKDINIAVIGLGYVGLPLALLIDKRISKSRIIGFDIQKERIDQLNNKIDKTGLVKEKEINNFFKKSFFTYYENELEKCSIFIVCVPTPVDEHKVPNLNPLKNASEIISKAIKRSEIKGINQNIRKVIIYESTVYPGVTEEICGSLLEKKLNCKIGEKFSLGYSPERVSPSLDNQISLESIVKLTSGSDEETRKLVDKFYSLILNSKTFSTSSIKIAEAAKVVENIQRDINIALMNELSLIFRNMELDTYDVIEAASTKWNFIPFNPGLVGGHCIGVDPYYLAYAAEKYNVHTELIKSGRRINDNMAGWIARTVSKIFNANSKSISMNSVLIVGACFKRDCPDLRNSQSIILAKLLEKYGFEVEVIDYLASAFDLTSHKGICINSKPQKPNGYGIIICTVAHKKYTEWEEKDWVNLKVNEQSLIFDIENVVPRNLNPIRF
ncbi:nucleotide sugar dehydrogenase [Prochlorococcus marinus]|uniref:nucleotide sugar dehydrogenase n=1 Tax=Prochlorococcus marinus TaxID=1219 RepID=UPI001C56FD97|nr:nucleotide sugar dehydrogenase [Prochlorococcus marinus]